MEDIESIIGFEALFESMEKCKKGVIYKDSVARYVTHAVEETIKLEEQLKNETYRARKPRMVKIFYPKRRDAISIAFRDRVYQRSLNDNSIYPEMSKSFIKENCACQARKGTEYARDLMAENMRKAFRKCGKNAYVLQCDIKSYYKSIPHDTAKKQFKRYTDEWTYEKAIKVLDTQYDGDTGFNPGSQMVQIAGIATLSPLDHFIKERLQIKCYVRYMDDFILIHEDEEYLKFCEEEIRKFLKQSGLTLNEKKTNIYPISKGVKFLGFIFKMTDTGKVLRLIDPDNVKHERKKLQRISSKVKRGEMTREKADQMYECWKAHAMGSKKKHCRKKQKRHNYKNNTYKVVQRMDAYYASLWKEDINAV